MATSSLQRYTSKKLGFYFGGYTIRENIRPEWLVTDNGARLELDFYIEELGVAIEVQGNQHYSFVPFFHASEDDYQKRLEYDQRKRDLCRSRGIELVEVISRGDIDRYAAALYEKLQSKKAKGATNKPLVHAPGDLHKPHNRKLKISKLVKTIVSYRKSKPEFSRLAHDELIIEIAGNDQLKQAAKSAAKRTFPVMPKTIDESYSWLWSD